MRSKIFKKVGLIVSLSFNLTYAFAQDNIFTNVSQGATVNNFTGDFIYNIPLLNIPGLGGGYTVGVQYIAGNMLEQSSSDVGLGWNLSAGGSINRKMVQYPDDWSGEEIITKVNCSTCVCSGLNSEWRGNAAYNRTKQDYPGNNEPENRHIPRDKYQKQQLYSYKANYIANQEKIEHAYGSLYQSNMPFNSSSNQGNSFQTFTNPTVDPEDYLAYLQGLGEGNYNLPTTTDNLALASDIYQKSNNGYLYDNLNPVHMAYDKYILSGPLSGAIQPFRFDNSSVAYPLAFNSIESTNIGKIGTYKFKVSPSQTQKVQFRFLGENTNNYEYHSTASTPEMTITPYDAYEYDALWCDLDEDDQWLKSAHYNNQPASITSMESTRAGFNATKAELAQAKYVQWFSNEEFNSTAKSKGLMNHQLSFDRSSSYYPAKGIGGFLIVDENGTTYHYTIPVYVNYKKAYCQHVSGPLNESTLAHKYAETWLLTGITGADFIDVNDNGIIDEGDTGYYVKFNYGKFHSDFKWRYPYSGTYGAIGDINSRLSEEGEREVYYLNSISTNTYTALFLRDYRKDNKSYYAGDNNKIRNSLKISDIVLLKNEDFNTLTDLFTLTYTNNVLLKSEILSISSDFINSNMIQKVSFTQDYSLCTSTPNSFDFLPGASSIQNPNGGKLTLNEISFYGKEDIQTMPNYEFTYNSFNPSYSLNKWDAWGYYKNVSSETDNRDANDDGICWNLDIIKSPTGGTLSIDYERDDYKSVNGYNITSTKKGDGLRVKSLTITGNIDENVNYKTNYIYTANGLSSGLSSGVCTSEPEFSRGTTYSFYDQFDSPGPMVCYSKVTVLPEEVNSGQEKEIVEYEFTTPNHNMISTHELINSGRIEFQEEVSFQSGCPYSNFARYRYGEAYKKKSYLIENKTSQIGNPISVKTYTTKGHLVQSINYHYEQSTNNGIYTQACNLVDKSLKYYYMFPDPTETRLYEHNNQHETRLINTISRYIPTVLSHVEVKKNDVITKTWESRDFLTNVVFHSIEEVGQRYKYKNINTPAYEKYAALGSKFTNESNKNMLNASCQQYRYNISDNVNNLIQTSVSVFSDQANYSEYNSSQYLFETVLNTSQPWRVVKNYSWKAHINSDGSYKTSGADEFVDYDWGVSATQDDHWKKTNEITLFDKNSNSLESKDIVGKYSATKLDHNSRVLTSASNTKYRDFGFSGAEDVVEVDHVLVNGHFDGEILKGVGSYIVDNYSHTGKNSLSVTDGGWAFVYRNYSPDITKRYKASVWVHENNVVEARLVLVMNDGGLFGSTEKYVSVQVIPGTTKKAGEWYLLELDVPNVTDDNSIADVDFMEIHAWNPTTNNGNTSPVYFDDFMVHPSNAPMTSYVYDEKTGLVTAIIDNNGMAIKHEYDEAGRLINSYKEVLNKGFVKMAEYGYKYAGQ